MLYFFIDLCMPLPILHMDMWPTVGHLVHTIATSRGCSGFYFFKYQCMPAPILHWDLWPTVGHLVLTIATQRGFYNESKFPTTLLVYSSAIYLQGMTFRYGLGAG